nr:two-component regulator propeller domain-containing protein [uncultured Dyadobacter sp.]
MWFSASSGIFRYDSHSFKNYRHNPNDSTSLAADYVTSIFSDLKGFIWACTANGLCRYNPKSESFKTFKPIPGDIGSISTDTVNCIAEDKQGNLWVGTYAGINKVTLTNGQVRFTRFLQRKGGAPAVNVQGIAADKKAGIWLATTDGLVWMNDNQSLVFKAPANPLLPSINDFTSILNDESGNIWLGTRMGGLVRFDVSSRHFDFLDKFQSPDGAWPVVSGFVKDMGNQIWIATMAGLANFDTRTFRTKWYVNDPVNDQTLAGNSVMSIFKDKEQGLWLGCYNNGIDYINLTSPVFSRWPFFIERGTRSKFNEAWIGLTPDKKPWLMAHDKSQIRSFDLTTNTLSEHDLDMSFAQNRTYFFVDESDQIWCGGNWVLWSYDFKKGVRKQYAFPEPKDTPYGRGGIKSIFQDKQRQLWVCGSFGVFYLDKKNGTIHGTGIDSSVWNVFEDSKGNIWCGGKNEVWLFPGGLGKPERIVLYKTLSSDMAASVDVWRITEDNVGRIWLATARALQLYDPTSHQFKDYPNGKDKLPRRIFDILPDRNGYLWLSSGKALLRYHPDRGTLQSYSSLDGLPKKATISPSKAQAANGILLFNTNQEMFSIDPIDISTRQKEATMTLSSLKLFNKEVLPDDGTGILHHSIAGMKELVFRHDQNIFTIEFALLSYARSHENHYQYKMTGFDKDWNETSLPTATYMNLPPGDYTFQVRAANGDGVWMREMLQVDITILPPWWKTWYAYLFYIVVFAAAVYAITRFFWLRTSFRKENALNKVKLDFFTNVSHEIRTHLSLISGPLEKVYEQFKEGKNIESNLNYARNNSDRLLLLVNELLDFRKVQSGGLRLQVREHDVIKTVKSVTAAFEHVSREKSIDTLVLCPETPVMLWLDIAQMQKVFYNLLSNAYKFTPEGGRITVRIAETAHEVQIAVEDTGKGMSEAHLQKLFTYYYQADSDKPGYGIGLALSKSIVEQHHGQLAVESRETSESAQGGTVLTIRMLRENRHFSLDEMAAKNNELVGSMLAETIATPANERIIPSGQRNTILIIEDNDQLRVFIRELFEGDYQTLEAENGLRGLDLANEHVPDIILSDVMMPEMNGLEVCNRLKNNETTSHIPVVLLTARTQNEQIIEGLSTGADDYLAKPFDPRILELKINNLIRVRDEMKARYRQSVVVEETTGLSIARDVNEAFIGKLRALVMENISDSNFGVNELAFEVGMSVSALYRKMRSLTDLTINEFVKTIRMNEAQKLLESGAYQVSEVSTIVGFEDSKYFSREFRNFFGLNPKDVKRARSFNVTDKSSGI